MLNMLPSPSRPHTTPDWFDEPALSPLIGSFSQKASESIISGFFHRLLGGTVLKTVWALSGGGAKGCFQMGALIFLSKNIPRYRPESVVGTSVGSINSLSCLEGAEGIDRARRVWLSLAAKSDMYEPQD